MSIIFERTTRNVCNILINRPHKRNALNLESIKGLSQALARFEEEKDLHVAIIGGIGGNFCAGYDLNDIVDKDTAKPKIKQIKQMLWPLETRLSNKKITIAAIDGHAAGFGFELALKCDFRIADRGSRLGFLNRRFGIPIMNGGTVILPQLIGLAKAMELVATGKAQVANEALEHGTITYISDVGCSMGRALNLARCLSKYKQDSLINDLRSTLPNKPSITEELLKKERLVSLEFLEKSSPLDVAVKFLKGELCRHGSQDLGNLIDPIPEVTL